MERQLYCAAANSGIQVAVVGTGYVGVVTAAFLAHLGHRVIGLDIDQAKIESLQLGIAPFYEPGLESLLKEQISLGRLQFTTSYSHAFSGSSYCFFCLPTPSLSDGSANLEYIESALQQCLHYLTSETVLIFKSTSPPGTVNYLKLHLLQRFKALQQELPILYWVSNPEFLREGTAIEDCFYPDRIVLGVESFSAMELMKKLYQPILEQRVPVIEMDLVSAELTKYAANGMLATRISFMNEISRICDALGGNILRVREGIASDKRIGGAFLSAGIGYGGSCFPKDVRAIVSKGEELGLPMHLLANVDKVNQEQRGYFYQKIHHYYNPLGGIKGLKIHLWGVSFKPNTDDIRQSPALDIIKWLLEDGAKIYLYDPEGQKNAKIYFQEHTRKESIHWLKTPIEEIEVSHGIILITEWKQFLEVDLKLIASVMQIPVLFDARNCLNPQNVIKVGMDYIGVGIGDRIQKHVSVE
jgi:UDPglucose 6-dehydrogenase